MWELFQTGGPVMWPLLLCSIVSLAVTLERVWFWARLDLDRDKKALETSLEHAARGEFCDVQTEKMGLVLRMLTVGAQVGQSSCAKAMETVALDAAKSMRRGMPVLDTIITIAPMLGILGTVLGIITSFDLLGQGGAPEDPKAVAAGIAEALITTAAGLGISVATVFPFNYFSSRIDAALDTLETYGARLEIARESVLPGGASAQHQTKD